jgi:hypothetical protein
MSYNIKVHDKIVGRKNAHGVGSQGSVSSEVTVFYTLSGVVLASKSTHSGTYTKSW